MSVARSPARVVLAALALAGCQRSWDAFERVALVAQADAPRLGVASSGHAIVVWTEDASTGVDSEIWAVRREPDGTWTIAESVGTGHAPVGAVDPLGGAVVVWQQGRVEAARVWAIRRTPAGWGPAEMLADGRAEDIDVAMDAAGNALAVFDAVDGIRARRHDGIGWREEELVNASGGSGARIAMNEAGDAFASWTYIQSDGADDLEYYGRVSHRRPGGVWSEHETLGGSQSSGSTVAVDDDGDAQAFWSEQNAGVWFERYLDAGGWRGARQVAPVGISAKAAGDGGGDAGVAWLDIGDEIRATYLVQGEPGETVTLTRGEEDAPPFGAGDLDMAAADGDAIAIWRRGTRIEVSHGDATGWDSPVVLDEGNVFAPAVAMFGSGDALALWLHRIDDDNVEIRSRTYR